MVLPGIGDVRTLEALSALAGEEEVPTRSVSTPLARPGGVGAACSGGPRSPGPARRPRPTVTTATVMRHRLPVDEAARGRPGMALVVDERNRMGWVHLTPWFATEPWRSAALELPTTPVPGRLVPVPGRLPAPGRAPEPDRDGGRGLLGM